MGDKLFMLVQLECAFIGQREELTMLYLLEFILRGNAEFLFQYRDQIIASGKLHMPTVDLDFHLVLMLMAFCWRHDDELVMRLYDKALMIPNNLVGKSFQVGNQATVEIGLGIKLLEFRPGYFRMVKRLVLVELLFIEHAADWMAQLRVILDPWVSIANGKRFSADNEQKVIWGYRYVNVAAYLEQELLVGANAEGLDKVRALLQARGYAPLLAVYNDNYFVDTHGYISLD